LKGFRFGSEELACKSGALEERFGKGNVTRDILDAFWLGIEMK
jgi:hypothetical protein